MKALVVLAVVFAMSGQTPASVKTPMSALVGTWESIAEPPPGAAPMFPPLVIENRAGKIFVTGVGRAAVEANVFALRGDTVATNVSLILVRAQDAGITALIRPTKPGEFVFDWLRESTEPRGGVHVSEVFRKKK